MTELICSLCLNEINDTINFGYVNGLEYCDDCARLYDRVFLGSDYSVFTEEHLLNLMLGSHPDVAARAKQEWERRQVPIVIFEDQTYSSNEDVIPYKFKDCTHA